MALERTEREVAEGWKCSLCADLKHDVKMCVSNDSTRSIRNCKKILIDKVSGSWVAKLTS